jgi:peptide/nickel transport system ATP-binding protein
VAEGILKLLDRLQKELNLAYMFITHDLATVRSIADEVVVMKDGKVVEQGPKDEMFRRRTTPTPTCCCPRCRRWTPTG